MKSVIWTGVLVKENSIESNDIISMAANKWQRNFINGLVSNKINVLLLTYMPSRTWPFGDLFPKLQNKHFIPELETIEIRYVNFPIIREVTLALNLARITFLRKNQFDMLITYNPFNRYIWLGQFAKRVLKKKWALVIADGNTKIIPDISILLSENSHSNYSGNKILIQGGVNEYINTEILYTNKKIILYSGSISKLTGLVNFVKLFVQLNDKNIELHIYGKGDDIELNELLINNSNVKYFGFVSQVVLEEAMKNAWIFVNPRNIKEEVIENTFPSKLLEYIRYGKPIISIRSLSIGKNFNNLIFYFDDTNKDSLEKLLYYIGSFNDKQLKEYKDISKSFCDNNSWTNIVYKFITSLN